MMKNSLTAACCALTLVPVCAAATVYVSPTGDDANPGTAGKPVRTLTAARDAARRTGAKTVVLGDGVYRQERPLALDAHDGGVTWRAAHRGAAVVSGSVEPCASGLVEAREILEMLPVCARGKVVFAELPKTLELPGFRGGGCGTPKKLQEVPVSVFQGERRLESARWPNEGFVRTGKNIGTIEKRHDATFCQSGVFAFAGDRMARWAKEPDLWAYGLWCYEWADAKAQVLKIDLEASTIAVDPSPIGFGIREDAQFYVMNALCELDRPGEWVLDRKTRRIYVWPLEDGGTLTFACAPGLVRARGARGIVFDGVVFDSARTDALTFEECSNCAVIASVVRRTSSWAVAVEGGVSNRVEGCDLYELGEGGVNLRGGDFRTLKPGGHVADNNHIHHYGRVVPNYRPGVQLNGVGNRATHNLIHHSFHQAVAFGGNDHYIGWNVIHDMCQYNDDAGSIYCCQRDWTKRGTIIERNVIHLTGKMPDPTHTEGVYLDDFSSGVIVRHNIINRADLGIYIGGGQDCRVYGNVILNCARGVHLGSRGIETFARMVSGKGRESEMFKRLDSLKSLLEGDLWRMRYPNLLKVYDFDDGVFAHNAFFNVITNNVCAGCGGISKDNWKNVGPTCDVSDNLEVPDDPGFADYANFAWELQADSEARRKVGELGFAQMGLYASPNRVSPAVKFGADIKPPPPICRRLHPATVRIDVRLDGDLPDGVKGMADGFSRCSLPDWGRGKRLVFSPGRASHEGWQDYSFSFTPRVDGVLEIVTMGTRGEKTLYDAFVVEGAELKDGDCEGGDGWRFPKEINVKDHRCPLCNTKRPWGVVTADETGVPAAVGTKMLCGNDMINASQRIRCAAGVPVTISFKARALPMTLLTAGANTIAGAGAPAMSTLIPRPRQSRDTWGWWKRCGDKRNAILDCTNGWYDVVFVGDSITHFWEDRGKSVYADILKEFSVLNLGFAGDRTENVLWRFKEAGHLKGYRAKLFMLMIGTNNFGGKPPCTPEQVAAGIAEIVSQIRMAHPESKVLLLPIFPVGPKPHPNGARPKTNRIIQGLADGKNVLWLDCYGNFIAPDGTISKDILVDGVHPTAKGYEIWRDAVLPVFRLVCGPRQ